MRVLSPESSLGVALGLVLASVPASLLLLSEEDELELHATMDRIKAMDKISANKRFIVNLLNFKIRSGFN